MDDLHPFPDLKIWNSDFLDDIHTRGSCPSCGRSRKYFCYNCYVVLPEIQHRIPKVQLPLKIDIIKHAYECDGKSTAVHAGVLAPDSVTIYTYPDIPDYSQHKRALLVYPGDAALTLWQLAQTYSKRSQDKRNDTEESTTNSTQNSESTAVDPTKNSENKEKLTIIPTSDHTQKLPTDPTQNKTEKTEISVINSTKNFGNACDPKPKEEGLTEKKRKMEDEESQNKKLKYNFSFDTVIFIDSTWYQTYQILADNKLEGLTQVKLCTYETKFWRHQKKKPDTYLATIEAIYYFLREYHEAFETDSYKGQYDNLLFLFCFFYKKIRQLYNAGKTVKGYQMREQKKKNKQK